MKQITTRLTSRHFSIPLLLALVFAGCSASTSPTGTTETAGSMVAMVNGYSWSSTVVPRISGGATATMNAAGALTITGTSHDHGAITLVLLHPQVGTDSLTAGST